MLVEYTSISETAKVWIYPSNRKFYDTEIEGVNQKIITFLESWNTDDETFQVSYKLVYNRFIVLFAASETPLTNLVIDASVGFILQLQEEYKVELLDKMNVCFKQGEYVQYKELKDFKKLIKNRAVTGKTIVFDNLVTTKEEFENYWEVPISESWYGRFLKQ
ncbi:MAG: ABC transporter ATPase [Polaribacter sp.]|nr:ABC transporter ATPase [Polaribacter sp.]MDG1811887.1 ABC transporter ATPase [Polaribacter sp.]MDG1993718.1 ABC transporter ATPase [Polaribacter sp.]